MLILAVYFYLFFHKSEFFVITSNRPPLAKTDSGSTKREATEEVTQKHISENTLAKTHGNKPADVMVVCSPMLGGGLSTGAEPT